jgi:hypothetical protein
LRSAEVYLEHAVRCWTAECQNADRLTHRMQLGATIAGLLIGIGFFKVEWFYRDGDEARVYWSFMAWIIKFLLVTAIFCFSIAFWMMAKRPKSPDPKPTASSYLYLGAHRIRNLPAHPEEATWLIFRRVHRAYMSLVERNDRLRDRMKVALRWFLCGIFATFGAVVLYIVFSAPPIFPDEPKESVSSTIHSEEGAQP